MAAGEVLRGADDAEELDGEPETRDRRHRLDRRRAARHVELHLGHFRSGLQRDAAAVERDGLAHEGKCRPIGTRGRVAHGDQRRLLIGALRHGREGAHPAGDDALAALDLDRQVPDLLGDCRGVLAERTRREVIGGSVLEIACAVHGICDDRRVRDGLPEVACARDDQALEPLRGPLRFVAVRRSRLVAIEAVVPEDRALDERRRGRRVAVCGKLPAQRARRELPSAVAGHRGGHPGALGGEVRASSEADEQPALASGVGERELSVRRAGLA